METIIAFVAFFALVAVWLGAPDRPPAPVPAPVYQEK